MKRDSEPTLGAEPAVKVLLGLLKGREQLLGGATPELAQQPLDALQPLLGHGIFSLRVLEEPHI